MAIGAESVATYHVEQGAGFPLILIHGVGMDLTMWDQHAGILADRYRVIRYDMVGHGRSGRPPGPYTLQRFVDQLLELMDRLSLPRAHIVGFSMGGLVAQAFAAQHPERVAALVLANTVAGRSQEQRAAVLDRVATVEADGHRATIDGALARWFTPQLAAQNPELVESVRRTLQNNDPASYLAAYRVFATADQEATPLLPRIESPTLIITAEEDTGSTPEMAASMHAQIPRSELVIVPGLKHLLPLEAPERFLDPILRFLAAQSTEAGVPAEKE